MSGFNTQDLSNAAIISRALENVEEGAKMMDGTG